MRGAEALVTMHTKRCAEPDRDAFARDWAEFRASPRFRATAYTELEAALIYAYAAAACAYTRPRSLAHAAAWPTGQRGVWAGGNPFRDAATTSTTTGGTP